MKKVVNFDQSKPSPWLEVGSRAMVWPVNHPDSDNVSNTTSVITSKVVALRPDGGFVTENSIYIPVHVPK